MSDYRELAAKVAELQFSDLDYVLLFRGQCTDYKNSQQRTSLKPQILRPQDRNEGRPRNPSRPELIERFNRLQRAEELLEQCYSEAQFPGLGRLKRQQILRWSILQHYEICCTPLLDVTHSLLVAASFASMTNKSEAFVFVLGVPNMSGAVNVADINSFAIYYMAHYRYGHCESLTQYVAMIGETKANARQSKLFGCFLGVSLGRQSGSRRLFSG